MAEITTFEEAVAAVPTLTKDPGTLTKLVLYGLYKQATVGDVQGKKPSVLKVEARAKYEAWHSVEGTSQEEAREEYIEKGAGVAGRRAGLIVSDVLGTSPVWVVIGTSAGRAREEIMTVHPQGMALAGKLV